MSARLAPSSRPLPLLFVALLFLFVFPRPSPPWVINVIIIMQRMFWGDYSAGTENEISRQPGRVLTPYFVSGGSQEQFYDIVSRFGIIYFFSFFPCVCGNKKNNPIYHVFPDPELKWQYYHHQIRGKCSPEQVLESPYSAWLANASSSRLTNCS